MYLAGVKELISQSIGDVCLNLEENVGNVRIILVKNVLLAPEIEGNLLSVKS